MENSLLSVVLKIVWVIDPSVTPLKLLHVPDLLVSVYWQNWRLDTLSAKCD